MRKKWWQRRSVWLIAILLLAGMVTLLFFPKPYYTLKAFFRGESYFDGYPTSYYRDMIVEDEGRFNPTHGIRAWLRRIGLEFERVPPAKVIIFPLQRGDPAAIPVLHELLHDSDARVRFFALLALDRIAGKSAESAALPALQQTTPDLERLLDDNAVLGGKKDFIRIAAASILLRMNGGHEKARRVMGEFQAMFPTGQ